MKIAHITALNATANAVNGLHSRACLDKNNPGVLGHLLVDELPAELTHVEHVVIDNPDELACWVSNHPLEELVTAVMEAISSIGHEQKESKYMKVWEEIRNQLTA